MRDLIFTGFQNVFSKGSPVTRPWEDWVELFSRHATRGTPSDTDNLEALDKAKNGPAVVLGEIPPGPRKAELVRSVHALALDLEKHPETAIAAALEALAPYEWVVWTTHKHGSKVGGAPRLRVVLPLAEPLPPSAHAAAWLALDRLIGNLNDGKTKDIARLHFLPSTFDPSLPWAHRNRGRWIEPRDLGIDLSALPDAASPPVSDAFDGIIQQKALNRITHQLRLIPKFDAIKDAAGALVAGESFAEMGDRHNTILALTMRIAGLNASLREASIAHLFSASLNSMREVAPDTPDLSEVWAAYQGAVEKLSSLDAHNREQAQRRAQEKQIRQINAGDGPYTPPELEAIAAANGWTKERLRDRWVVQRDGTAWFLTGTGEYAGPYGRDDLSLAASKYLARAPIRLVEATRNGFRYRSISDVVRESGSLADRVVSDLTLQRTKFDPETRTMHEAISPMRDIAPTFDPEFDTWMRIAAGALYGKLVDWMATAPDLSKLLCAIYFEGAPSSGKTLFAYGLSKIWTEGPPADIEAVLSDFNDELCRCPLVLADEEIPKRHRQTVTTTLRSMLSTLSRTLKRKYRATSEVRGAVRLILAANNEFLLDNREVSSSQDLDAIAQRFLYVPVPQEATDYLNTLPRAKKEYWATEGIARHALWLLQNHEVKEPGKRFYVEGDVSQMHRLLMTGSRWNSLACEWLVRYLMTPQPFDTRSTGLIRRGDGELLVNDQALMDGWSLYIQSTRIEPETSKIGAALRAISKSGKRKQLRYKDQRIRYRTIDAEHLLAWSDRFNIGDKEVLLAAIGNSLLKPRKEKNPVEDLGTMPAANPEGRPL